MSLRGVRRVKLPVRKLAPGAIGLEGCKMTGNQNDRKLSPERGGRSGVAPHRGRLSRRSWRADRRRWFGTGRIDDLGKAYCRRGRGVLYAQLRWQGH